MGLKIKLSSLSMCAVTVLLATESSAITPSLRACDDTPPSMTVLEPLPPLERVVDVPEQKSVREKPPLVRQDSNRQNLEAARAAFGHDKFSSPKKKTPDAPPPTEEELKIAQALGYIPKS